MARIREWLGSGWPAIAEQTSGSLEPDTLQLKIFSASAYTVGIHVSARISDQEGELLANVRRTGEWFSFGEGVLLPYKGGIRLVAADERRRNRLRVHVIANTNELISLYFQTKK